MQEEEENKNLIKNNDLQNVTQLDLFSLFLKQDDDDIQLQTFLKTSAFYTQMTYRQQRLFLSLINKTADIDELKNLLWVGVTNTMEPKFRLITWQMILEYLPAKKERRLSTLMKKRDEYFVLVKNYYETLNPSDNQINFLKQIRVDIPRISSNLEIFNIEKIQKLVERLLFIFATRHPATGYVQGLNELLIPILTVSLKAYFIDFETISSKSQLNESILNDIEADSYWCFSKILADIQDHYTFGQPGIQRQIEKLRGIIKRIDEPLFGHFTHQGVNFLHIAFRWMNCFMIREMPLDCVVRLWDSYIAESYEGFSSFHIYVCAVFLTNWSNDLRNMDFQQIMLFIQNPPTSTWTSQNIETLLAEAFILKNLYHLSPNHLN